MLFRCAPHCLAARPVRAPETARGPALGSARDGATVTIDIHCHIHVPEADDMLAQLPAERRARSYGQASSLTDTVNRRLQERILPKLTDPEERLRDMDEMDIDIQAVSPSPFHYNYDTPADFARETSRLVNGRVAEIVASQPDRFVGLGTVPLQNCELAIAEMERCVDELGFRGIEISTNVAGRELTRAGLDTFFARAEELDLLLFIHPIGTSIKERMGDHYFNNLIAHPFESALAVGHLIFDGTLETYPDLKICIAHGGGYIPAYSGRFDHPFSLREDCRVKISKPPSEYLKKLYFDSVVFTEHQLRYLIETWGADHVLLGTDYPYDMAEPDPVGHVSSVRGLGDADRAKVLGGNAARLLRLEPSRRPDTPGQA